MLTSGVFVLLGMGVLGLTFVLVSKWRGAGRAFLMFCWAPLAALAVPYVARARLGYAILAILMVVTVASLGLAALGVVLTGRARRSGSPDARGLAAGTIVAGIPALIVIVAALWPRVR